MEQIGSAPLQVRWTPCAHLHILEAGDDYELPGEVDAGLDLEPWH
jgi:hypothetical protein